MVRDWSENDFGSEAPENFRNVKSPAMERSSVDSLQSESSVDSLRHGKGLGIGEIKVDHAGEGDGCDRWYVENKC